MKQDLDEFRNQMEDLYHDRSVKPMKDYYQNKKDKLIKVIQAAKVLRKNPNSSMKNPSKKDEKESKEKEKDGKSEEVDKEQLKQNELALIEIEDKLNKVDAELE